MTIDTSPADGKPTRKPPVTPEKMHSSRLRVTLEGGVLPILLVLLIVLIAVIPTSGALFLSAPNVANLLRGQSVTGVIAIAMVIPLVCGYFDLSVAATAGIASVTFATVVGTQGLPIWVGIIAVVAVSLVIGCINGFLVAYARFDAFVITLGTYTLLGGIIQWFTNGRPITEGIPDAVGDWGAQKVFGLPQPFLALIIVALVVWYVLMHTAGGRNLESIGSNQRAAHLIGVPVARTVFASFLASALFGGVAGLLLISSSGVADPSAGPNYLFPAITAVFLGATSIRPGRYNVWGTVLATFFIAIAINGFSILGADSWITPVFNGFALVFAVAASTLIRRSRRKS
jgi:ribose transport system permease protein